MPDDTISRLLTRYAAWFDVARRGTGYYPAVATRPVCGARRYVCLRDPAEAADVSVASNSQLWLNLQAPFLPFCIYYVVESQ